MFFSSEGSSVGEKFHQKDMPSSSESYSLKENALLIVCILKENRLINYSLEDPELRNKLREMGFSNNAIGNILSGLTALKETEKHKNKK